MKMEIISQYKASLKMLLNTIDLCPASLWDGKEYENTFWCIVYHTLFYRALYLAKSPSNFSTWTRHIENYNNLGKFTHDNKPIVVKVVYSKNDLKKYLEIIVDRVEKSINEMEDKKRSKFHWIPGTEVERHLYNIRHIQHHTGQLIERLHINGIKGIKGIKWEGVG